MGYMLETPMLGLAKAIFKRDFKSQFRRTLFGPLLAFLSPVIYLTVFIFFRMMFGLPKAEGIPTLPFLFSGIALWLFFSTILGAIYPGVSANMGILRKMPVNPLIFAISATGMPLLTISIYLALLLCMSLYFGVAPSWTWLCLPFLVILVGLFAMGLGLFVCALGIYKRDIIVLPAQLRWAVSINPMAHAVTMFRDALFLEHIPAAFPLGVTCGMTLLAWLVGYPLFRRTMRYAADTI